METKYVVYLVMPIDEASLPSIALQVADDLNISIAKMTRLLDGGMGPLTKPTSRKAAEKVAGVLYKAGANVEVREAVWNKDVLMTSETLAQPSFDTMSNVSSKVSTPWWRQFPAWLLTLVLALLGVAVVLWMLRIGINQDATVLDEPISNSVPVQDDVTVASLEDLQALAAQGQVDAQFELAERYTADSKDDTAIEWYIKAADQGYAKAQYSLGKIYLEQEALNYQEAFKWFSDAAALDHPEAQYELAWLYASGLGTERDLKKAVDLYQQAADQGQAEAQYQLGFLYFYDYEDLPQDYETAAKWFRLAADQGIAEAQNKLGDMYLNGLGVDKDEKEAQRWYELAERQGLEATTLNVLTRLDIDVEGGQEALAEDTAQEEGGSASGDAVAESSNDLEEEPEPEVVAEEPALDSEGEQEARESELEADLPDDPDLSQEEPLEEVILPSIFAIAREGEPQMIIDEILTGQNVNIADVYGQTPLMYAASGNLPAAVTELVSGGADINAQSKAGWTALMYAARGNPDALPVLLLYGADPALINSNGQTAFDLVQQYHPDKADLFGEYQ